METDQMKNVAFCFNEESKKEYRRNISFNKWCWDNCQEIKKNKANFSLFVSYAKNIFQIIL